MSHRFDPAILREYDVRGPVGPRLGAADAEAWGRSFGTVVRRAGGARVAVGRDGRLSSPALEPALVRGLAASGCDVVRIGLGPTPMLHHAAAALGADAGVQVTGSHNPRDDNGFKMALRGAPYHGEDIQACAALAAAGDWEGGEGEVTETDAMHGYLAHLAAALGGARPTFRIGWDAGNGAAGPAVEQLVQRLPGEHHLLFTDVDGEFPNHHPDPTVEANLAALRTLVTAKRLDFGVAFDGDGDRIGAVDGRGRVVWGDQLLAILAEPVLAAAPGAAVVADVKASAHLFRRIAQLGGRPVMAPSGHSRIRGRMAAEGAPLAGELSGHIFFADAGGVDDALLAAVRLMAALAAGGRSLADAVDAMPPAAASPELRFAVGRPRAQVMAEVRGRLAGAPGVCLVDGVRVDDPDGWWLLRASGTQDLLTARAEGRDEAALARLIARLDAELARSGVAREVARG